MPEIIILVGKPCSGKTTWAAKQEGYAVISRDDIKKSLFSESHKISLQNQEIVNNEFNSRLLLLIQQKKNIICDRCNLQEGSIDEIKKCLTPDYEMEIKKFTVPLALIYWRKCKRYFYKKIRRLVIIYIYRQVRKPANKRQIMLDRQEHSPPEKNASSKPAAG